MCSLWEKYPYQNADFMGFKLRKPTDRFLKTDISILGNRLREWRIPLLQKGDPFSNTQLLWGFIGFHSIARLLIIASDIRAAPDGKFPSGEIFAVFERILHWTTS